MNEYEVTCINKPDRFSINEHITHIGNIKNNWRLTSQDAINRIELGNEKFYVLNSDKTKKVYIGVVEELGKRPYLRTYADGIWTDNLLSLQECGNNCRVL